MQFNLGILWSSLAIGDVGFLYSRAGHLIWGFLWGKLRMGIPVFFHWADVALLLSRGVHTRDLHVAVSSLST